MRSRSNLADNLSNSVLAFTTAVLALKAVVFLLMASLAFLSATAAKPLPAGLADLLLEVFMSVRVRPFLRSKPNSLPLVSSPKLKAPVDSLNMLVAFFMKSSNLDMALSISPLPAKAAKLSTKAPPIVSLARPAAASNLANLPEMVSAANSAWPLLTCAILVSTSSKLAAANSALVNPKPYFINPRVLPAKAFAISLETLTTSWPLCALKSKLVRSKSCASL